MRRPFLRCQRMLRGSGLIAKVAVLAIAWLSVSADVVRAQDQQIIRVGNGLPGSLCVERGLNGIRDSLASGDDFIFGEDIQVGSNGICESTPNSLNPGGDDAHPSDITLGQGQAFRAIINPGALFLCDSPVTLQNDDVRRVMDPTLDPPGTGTPRQVAVRSDPGATIESTAGGDDVITALICPDSDGTIESVVTGDDQISAANDLRCAICPFVTTACITPGPDDTLDSTAAGTDEEREYVSAGANGRSETTAAGTDLQAILVGRGHEFTICVDSGADGIADSTLCGNGVPDVDENGISFVIDLPECEDSNQISGDGCNSICQTEFCGDGVTQPGLGEGCDSGAVNTAGCDFDCTLPMCGDGIANMPAGETCDTSGESATCDANCTAVTCGDFTTNTTAGEDCDTGGVNTLTCDSDCSSPLCGDSIENTPAGEECDDGNTTPNDGCNAVCDDEVCGDLIVQTGIGEECEDGNFIDDDGCDSNCTFTACGNGIVTSGEQCDDAGESATCDADCTPAVCGDLTVNAAADEVCDEGGETATCDANCTDVFCGDGTPNAAAGEECDDGNTKNNDACVVGCQDNICGDGFKNRGVEQCDDGNTDDGDGCSAGCLDEEGVCGDGAVNGLCSAGDVGTLCVNNTDCDTGGPPDGECDLEACDDSNNSGQDDCTTECEFAVCGDGFVQTKGTPPFEECDDGNTVPGDGCSATCENECGNGVIDGACSQGLVGQYCQNNGDCDTGSPGVCLTEPCDWGISGLCLPGPSICSAVCLIATCGNGAVECDEECDLGPNNGVSGSGCTSACERNLIGAKELTGRNECVGAWTLDSPPQDASQRRQACTDGAPCDFDVVPGQCTLRIGYCLNRPLPASCTPGDIVSVDLLRLRVTDPVHAAAAEGLTNAIAALAPSLADVPDRCREGERRKICSIPDNAECDTYLGASNGFCDIGTGVSFTPALDPGVDQITTCTPGVDVVLPAGEKLSLLTKIRRNDLPGEKDSMRVSCEP